MAMQWRFVFLVLLVACHSKPKITDLSKNQWPDHMQSFAHSVVTLAPFIYNSKNYVDPAHHDQIAKELHQFSDAAHDIKPDMGEAITGSDPLVQYSLVELKADVSRAEEAFKNGHLDYSRGVMKNVMAHCFQCHSLSDSGTKTHFDVEVFKNLKLSPLEKADLFIASRDFDDSKRLLELMLKNSDFSRASAFEFESALHRYMALMVRVQKDPKGTLLELKLLQKRKEIPVYIHDLIQSWSVSLKNWEKEKPNSQSLMLQAEKHFKAAQKLQAFPKDHQGDVEYLRVTSLLHDFLKLKQSKESEAEAYVMLGQSYEVLDDLGVWNLHEMYYESCVRRLPQSDLAKNCFQRLQSSIQLGFSGSAGVNIPENETKHLEELKKFL